MDVIALHQAGFDNAVASLGTALTSGHANLLKRYTKNVYLTYDSDGAGVKAALRAIPILKEVGITTKVINMKLIRIRMSLSRRSVQRNTRNGSIRRKTVLCLRSVS